jgi:hypothetical protein
MHACPHVKCLLLLSNTNQHWNMSRNFSETPCFIKIRVAVIELQRRDGRTDMAKLLANSATFRCERDGAYLAPTMTVVFVRRANMAI